MGDLPRDGRALKALGRSLTDARQFADAVSALDEAIAMDGQDAEAHRLRGLALLGWDRRAEAMASCSRATQIGPDTADNWVAFGRVLGRLGFAEMAVGAFTKASALAPNRPFLRGRLLQEKLAACDWQGIDALVDDIDRRVAAGERAVHPFYWQTVSHTNASLQAAARAFHPRLPVPDSTPHAPPGQRIRIGYVSGELGDQANGLTMAGVFDHHDKGRFEVTAFYNGPDDDSAQHRRIRHAFDAFVPVRNRSDADVAAAVRAAGIDILVNLNGFFGHERNGLFAQRPAPVQVSFLGCPGTMGAPFIDYLIADAIVLPDADRPWYDEHVVRMAQCYFPADNCRAIADRTWTRAECGLPDAAMVFCCFNNSHKITPHVFALWMHILSAVDGSVLWLLLGNASVRRNLRAAATAHGIDPDRLVFAERVAPPDHLARHACADLFLDTLPYNAHTTATDALWTGLPVLTQAGRTWPGRVAASMLHGVGMDALVVDNDADYVATAVRLAQGRAALDALRRQLATHRATASLFDGARFTRALEACYAAMHGRRRAGLPPADMDVAAP